MSLHIGAIRPRVVSVVAVVWLYLGSSWLIFGALLTLLLNGIAITDGQGGTERLVPISVLLFFAGFAVTGGLGVRGALQLLKLESRGRRLLEWTNWLAFVGSLLTTWCASVVLSRPLPFAAPNERAWFAAIVLFAIGSAASVPFAIMAKTLRSEAVRLAVSDAEARRNELATEAQLLS